MLRSSIDFGDGRPRHPTQIYEAIFHSSMALGLAWLQRKGWLRGQLIKLYIIVYLCYRFATEFIRPELLLALGLTAYQWACLVLVPIFVFLWVLDCGLGTRCETAGGAEVPVTS